MTTRALGFCLVLAALLESRALAAPAPKPPAKPPAKAPAKAADTTPPVVRHEPIGAVAPSTAIVVKAELEDPSGIFDANVYFRSQGEPRFKPVSLVSKGGSAYEAVLPAPSGTRPVEYYIATFDGQGNGPSGAGSEKAPLVITIGLVDQDAPSLTDLTPPSVVGKSGVSFVAEIVDPSGVFEPTAYHRRFGETRFAAMPLQKQDGLLYSAELGPVTAPIEYYLEAYDENGNGPARVGSPDVPKTIDLVAAAPGAAPTKPPKPVPAAALAPAPEAPPRKWNFPALGVVGAGVLAAAVGAVLYTGAADDVARIDAAYQPGQGRLPADADAIQSAQGTSLAGSAAMISGSALLAGGLVWFFLPSGE